MAKRTRFDNMSASDLARETRALGLDKPNVLTRRDWASWLNEQSMKTPTASEPAASDASGYDAMTVAELRTEAERRKVDTAGLRLKSEYIDALEAADGMREEQQAAMDGVTFDEAGSANEEEAK